MSYLGLFTYQLHNGLLYGQSASADEFGGPIGNDFFQLFLEMGYFT